MKTSILLSLFLFTVLICLQSQAQTPQQKMAAMLHKKDSAINASRHSTAKTTNASGSRLVAAYLMGENSAAVSATQDSEAFSYSGSRGGDLTHILDYDTLTIYQSGLSYIYEGGAAAYGAMQIQTFDANNNILTRIFTQLYNPGSAYVNYFKQTNTYDASNNLLTSIDQSWDTTTSSWVNTAKYEYTYDGNNNNLSTLIYYWNDTTSVWYLTESYAATYTASNKLQAYSYQQLIGSVLTPTQIDTLTYDVNDNLLTDLRQNWNTPTNSWVNDFLTSYTYNANNLLNILDQYWNTSTNSWVNSSQTLYTYDANNNELSDLNQYWSSGWISQTMDNYSGFVAGQPLVDSSLSFNYTTNTMANSVLYTYTYNNYNQRTSEADVLWSSGNSGWESYPYEEDRYYYQLYTLAVNPVSSTGGRALVYPVPAQNVLHIDLTWDTPQASSIALYDVQGKILKQWQVPAATTYSNTIEVNDLAAGNYFINITGTRGQIIQKLVVTK